MIDFSVPNFGSWEFDPQMHKVLLNAAAPTTFDFMLMSGQVQYSILNIMAVSSVSLTQVWTINIVRAGIEYIVQQQAAFAATQVYPLRAELFLAQGDFLRFRIPTAVGTETVSLSVLGFIRNCKRGSPKQEFPPK